MIWLQFNYIPFLYRNQYAAAFFCKCPKYPLRANWRQPLSTGRIFHNVIVRAESSFLLPVPILADKTLLPCFVPAENAKPIACRTGKPAAKANSGKPPCSGLKQRYKHKAAKLKPQKPIICTVGSGQQQGRRTAHSPGARHGL